MKNILLLTLVISLLVSCKKNHDNTIIFPGDVSGPIPILVGQTGIYKSTGTAGGTWSTSNPHIATVSSSGVVSGISEGTVAIIYTISPGVSASANLIVNDTPCALIFSNVVGTWKMTGAKYKQTPASAEQDYYDTYLCKKDDHYVLNWNRSYYHLDVGAVCTMPNNFNGTWFLTGNTINIGFETGNVDSFSCTTMIVSYNSVWVPGDKMTKTFTKQ